MYYREGNLMSDLVIKGSDQNFIDEVIESKVPVLVDFWAEWCAPCRMIGPFLEQIAKEYEGKIKVIKFNVDECPKNAEEYKVVSIPTLIVFKDGKAIQTKTGALPLVQIKALVDNVL